jgi:hypothetical protein
MGSHWDECLVSRNKSLGPRGFIGFAPLKARIGLFVLLLFLALAAVIPQRQSLAMVSTNVPLDDVSYFYLEKLIMQGLIQSDTWATRPFSRFEMGRLISEARKNWKKLPEEERQKLPLIRELLSWLEKRYAEEIGDIEGSKKAATTYLKPADRVSATIRYQNEAYSTYNNEGLEFYDGTNAAVDVTMHARVAGVLGLFAQPRFVYYGNAENARDPKGGEVDESNFDLQKWYAKLDVMNIELQYGADSLWWNPSYHGSLIMSNNAEPFPVFKLSNPIPTVLPWVFDILGLFKYTLVFGTLDSNRLNPIYPNERLITDHDDPYFAGIHLDFKPLPWFEFGFNLSSIYGGEGRDLSFSDHMQIIFFNDNLTGDLSSNAQFTMFWQFRFRNPLPISETLSFYGEWGGEDAAFPPDRRAYQLGLLFGDFLKLQGRLQLQLEYTNTSPQSNPTAWYTHPQFPATYEGRVFGHHLGTDGQDFFAGLSFLWSRQLKLFLEGDYEKRRTSLDNSERVLQGKIGALYDLSDNMSVLGSMGIENVDNLDYVEGASDNRSFFSLRFLYYF